MTLPLSSSGLAYSGIRSTVFIISAESLEISIFQTTRNFIATSLPLPHLGAIAQATLGRGNSASITGPWAMPDPVVAESDTTAVDRQLGNLSVELGDSGDEDPRWPSVAVGGRVASGNG